MIYSIGNYEQFQAALNLLELLLVVTALLATTSETVSQTITYYQWQSALLAVVVTATAISRVYGKAIQSVTDVGFLILIIALLPMLLLAAIRPLLHRATLAYSSKSTVDDLKMVLAADVGPMIEWFGRWQLRTRGNLPTRDVTTSGVRLRIIHRLQRYRELERDAEAEWRRRQTLQRGLGSLLLYPLLVLVALLVPFAIPVVGFDQSERIGLAVSLALHLIGLFNMIVKRDIISQVVGLLIMDQGIYLAVVKIIEIPVPADLFVLSLYFYTLITVFILVILLPQIRVKTNSIDLAEIATKSDLKSGVES